MPNDVIFVNFIDITRFVIIGMLKFARSVLEIVQRKIENKLNVLKSINSVK